MTGAGYVVERIDELAIHRPAPLRDMYLLSPCVWKEREEYHILVRAVNRSSVPAEKISRIYHGVGRSALEFWLDESPVIAPGPQHDDLGGCEDPTLVRDGTRYWIYYTGWNQTDLCGNLLLATGSDIHALTKRGRVFDQIGRFRNAKEATVIRCRDGSWRLFFEFAEGDRSAIGIATGTSVDGPWTFADSPFSARPDCWDSWHLSTGPMMGADPAHPVMFYNGAGERANWRIGWVEFDERFTRIVARSAQPLVAPPKERADPEDTDIVFAASLLREAGQASLYYSVADRVLMRAVVAIRDVPDSECALRSGAQGN